MKPNPNSLKAISQTDSELRVGNYMVLFGGKDLTGEFFTKSTNFESNYTDIGLLYVDFEHGRDAENTGNSADNVLGIADWKSAKVDETGVFVERVLNRRATYVKYLLKLIEEGIIGTSSAAIPGTPRKARSGEILDWPLMRDTLTVTPMEPRMVTENMLTVAKALAAEFPNSKSLALLTGGKIPNEHERSNITTIREFEDFLRDAGGFSKSQAVAIACGGWKTLQDRRDSGGADGAKEYLSFLQSISEKST